MSAGFNTLSTRRVNRRILKLEIRKKDGARVDEVDEHRFGRAVVVFEFEAYPEPKILLSTELRALHARYKSFYRVGDAIGASEGFARQNSKMFGKPRK